MKGNKQMKTQKKASVKRVEIKLHSLNWENQLPLYLDLYSKLSDQGKKEMKDQLKNLGKQVDIYQKEKTKKERKEIK